jgi:hypothetical protein
MKYLVEPQELSVRKPCPELCRQKLWCVIKPMYGVPPCLPT